MIERPKRSKQFSKEELENAIKECNNNKELMVLKLGINSWSLREQLKRNGLNFDDREQSNKKRQIPIPPKEELEKLYNEDNLTLLEIGKHYGTSNVTVKKWMVLYELKLLTHSQTISKKVIPKIKEYNQKNFGYNYYFGSEKGKKKVADKFIEKYGVPYHPIGTTSLAEIEVLEFFNKLEEGFEKAHIFGIELDGYNKNINIAYEYCGIFWHKESIKGKELHIKKYKICSENGIKLFTIFEDEWLNKQEQVKSFIRASLHKNTFKKYARKLHIKMVDGRDIETLNFIEEHHIQGAPNFRTTINHFVLYDEYNIYSVMSFSKHHRNINEIVLSRYCVKKDYDIIGGSSKLFHHASKFFNCSLKTWSDNRWSDGLLYERLGFKKIKDLPKDYSYVYKKERISKQKMTKTKIGASDEQTEYERALELGYDRIWDCGKKTWEYKMEKR